MIILAASVRISSVGSSRCSTMASALPKLPCKYNLRSRRVVQKGLVEDQCKLPIIPA